MEDFEDEAPIALHARAMENLSFIRDAMERSTPFTGISGKGMIVMGLIALAGGHVARLYPARPWWVYSWLVVALLGCLVGVAAMVWKMRALEQPSVARAARRFALNVAPAVLAGVVLTRMFFELALTAFMPGMWLLLYGAGVVAGGALSVRVVPLMGAAMMALGAATLLWTLWGARSFAQPDFVGELALALGFGGLHILSGIVVWRRYGG